MTSSTRRAAVDARNQLFAKVAPALKAQPEELEAVNATVRVKGDPSRSLSWKEACSKIGAMPMTIRGKNPDKSKPPDLTNSGVGGVQMADVSVDTETGIVRVNKMVAVQDCGLVVDVKTAESQVLGALIMGISYALYEEKILDPVTGRMLNPNMEFYRLAGIADIGELKVHMMTGKGYDERGVIGLAEPPVVSPGAAISNAVANAIGVRVPFLPLTPNRVLEALEKEGPMRGFEYVTPTKKEQVATLLGEQGSILAGGTDLLALMKDDVVTPKRLVNIKQIDGLRGISYQPGNGLRIGALTTLAELVEAKTELAAYPMLMETVNEAASPQIRNLATIGGNMCQRPRCWYFRNGMGLMAKAPDGKSLVVEGDNRYCGHPRQLRTGVFRQSFHDRARAYRVRRKDPPLLGQRAG